jgi:tetrapyrrole methylase family protein/MazG family protein
MTGITLLGLGPGNPKYLTREAWQWLEGISEIYLYTSQHPAVAAIPSTVKCLNFDSINAGVDDIPSRHKRIVSRIMKLGKRSLGVTFGIPGNPHIDSNICEQIIRKAVDQGIPIRVIEGLSILEPVVTALGIHSLTGMVLMDAKALKKRYVPAFPPNQPFIISPVGSKSAAAEVKMVLGSVYPDEHPVMLIHALTTENERIENLKLFEIDQSPYLSAFTSLYVPPMNDNCAFETFQEVVARLRAPDGCPWDREQTHSSLRQHLLEESYETLEAIDSGNMDELREELGDLLLQIVLNTQIASENGDFNMTAVINGICTKIISRHPHVFGDAKIEGVGGVLKNWERLKEQERQDNGSEKKGLMDGAPTSLPALAYAHEIQERAARVGFDWPEIGGVIAKLREELDEVLSAKTVEEQEGEIGDLAFAVVNLARWLKVDPESALRESNRRFKQRFAHIEDSARMRGVALASLSFDEMDRLWEEAKDNE